MLFILPWVFMFIAIGGVILLWDDWYSEMRYNEYQREAQIYQYPKKAS